MDSNHQLPPYEDGTLPIELRSRRSYIIRCLGSPRSGFWGLDLSFHNAILVPYVFAECYTLHKDGQKHITVAAPACRTHHIRHSTSPQRLQLAQPVSFAQGVWSE